MIEYKLSQVKLDEIKKHYRKLEPHFTTPSGKHFGYLWSGFGWYMDVKTENTTNKQLGTFEHAMSKFDLRNFTLFQTLNRYETGAQILTDIPLKPNPDPTKPAQANVKGLANREVQQYMVYIDIDMAPDKYLIENMDIADKVIEVLKEFFAPFNNVYANSGNGIYSIFPASSMDVTGCSEKDKDILREAWKYLMDELREDIYTKVPEAEGLFIIDNIFNNNRYIKTVGSIHKSNGFVVLPFNKSSIKFKYVDELTQADYDNLGMVIDFLYQESKENTELKDILKEKGYMELAEDKINNEYCYEGQGHVEVFENEVPFEIIMKDPLYQMIFDINFKAIRPNHRALNMAYALRNLGYTQERMKQIMKHPAYNFSDSTIERAIVLGGHETAAAPNYLTVIKHNAAYPSPACKDDYGSVQPPHGFKNPIKYIKAMIQDEERLITEVKALTPQDQTDKTRQKIRNISKTIIENADTHNALNEAPPRAGKTHSTIAEMLQHNEYGSLIFGESHEQLQEMEEKFPQLYRWQGKQLLCNKTKEYKEMFDAGLNPCFKCPIYLAEDDTQCEWRMQLKNADQYPHILINKANIWNTIAEGLIKTPAYNAEGDLVKRSRVIYDENLNKLETEKFRDIKSESLYEFTKLLQQIQDSGILDNIDMTMAIDALGYSLFRFPRDYLYEIHGILSKSAVRKEMYHAAFDMGEHKGIRILTTYNTVLTNLMIIATIKEEERNIEDKDEWFMTKNPFDHINPTILLDATPSPYVNLEDYQSYNVKLEPINSIILRPMLGDIRLTYSRGTAQKHNEAPTNTYIDFIQTQIDAAHAAGLTVGLITYQKITYAGGEEQNIDDLFPEVDKLYYGGVRGMSDLDDKDVLIILGTWKIPPKAIYPEYRYRGGQKSFQEIQDLYDKNEVETLEDGSTRKICGDALFDGIALHEIYAEMEQAILRNMPHLKTRLVICIGALPKSLQHLNQVEFNWSAREFIEWEKIYKQYRKIFDDDWEDIEIPTFHEAVACVDSSHVKRDTERKIKRNSRKEAKEELMQKVREYRNKNLTWFEIYDITEGTHSYKSVNSLKVVYTKWIKANE